MKFAITIAALIGASEAKLGAPARRAPKFLQSDAVIEPGKCCWSKEVFEAREEDDLTYE